MDTKRLQYFCTIVEQGQISRAAKVLYMSQPPLSQRLKELEEELGATLILRDGGRWHVTDAGKILYEQAKKILAEMVEIKRQVHDAAMQLGGQVSIGVSTTCEMQLLNTLPRMYARYPALRFRLVVIDSSFLEKNILENNLDIAILLLPLERDEYNVSHLPPVGFSVVYHPSLAPQAEGPVRLEALEDVPLLLSRRWGGGGSYDTIVRHWQEQDKTPPVILDSHNIHTLLRLIEMGMPAATVVPSSEITDSMRQRLPVHALAYEGLRNYPVLITKKGRFLSRAVRLAADVITAEFDGEQLRPDITD